MNLVAALRIGSLCLLGALPIRTSGDNVIPKGGARLPEAKLSEATSAGFHEFCFKCHEDTKAKGRLNLQRMSEAPDFETLFKTWEKVIDKLETREMPPEDERQPSAEQRNRLIADVREALDSYIRQTAGDPGRIAMRRLTSAEYGYAIHDLTGLELGLDRNFISDAVGGEGFSNVGDVQFIQDSTLERYLEAAKLVASHAVVAAGPLRFYRDPGKTGQELSAIRRIQEIYERHGFRTASGEGGKAFGLERYPKAFYAAWRFKHRRALDLENESLGSLAHEEGLDAPFVEHIWAVLHEKGLPFPANEIATAWDALPAPKAGERHSIRADCEKVYDLLQGWQIGLAENTGDAEVASILTETSFRPSLTNAFRVRLAWPPGTETASFQIAVAPVAGQARSNAAVLWKRPTLRFRKPAQGAGAGGRARPTDLRAVVTDATAERLNFGRGIGGAPTGTNDFITSGFMTAPIEFKIPPGAPQAELLIELQLDPAHLADKEDCVVRCVVSHDLNEGATAAATGTFSLVLANPNGATIDTLKTGIATFARVFPQISQREAAPADRDPIPPPFNSDYNNAERNEFHATIKYHRDDRFLTEHVLEDKDRQQLDEAWTDLLTAFDYHETYLRFVAKKYGLQLSPLAKLDSEQIEHIPEEPRRYVRWLRDGFVRAQQQLERSARGHVDDAIHFAELAWRRPLSEAERERLRAFYAASREELDDPAALQALIARILISPAFLYRIEAMPAVGSAVDRPADRIALTDWELASRLSFFLACSIPDDELRRAAAAGELRRPEQLVAQAKRLLRDGKARRFATEFFGQWFGFYRFDHYRGVDTTRFTEFTDALKNAMYDEAVSFFENIVREDRPVHEILFADYSFLNRDLAAHYGIPATRLSTNELSRFEGVGQFHRGGLLRLGAVLTSTSAPLRTSAVKRGDWILRRVLGRGVPPPPGDAGSIPPDDVLPDGKTVRERLEAHRRDSSCVNCHARMDPLGFSLEHFDSIGRWRDTYRDGQKIDANGRLNDGTEIAEFEGLNEYLLRNEAVFNRTLCAKLLGFALGRSELASDRPLLDRMAAGLKSDNRFSTLVAQIVSTDQFRFRRAEERMRAAAE